MPQDVGYGNKYKLARAVLTLERVHSKLAV